MLPDRKARIGYGLRFSLVAIVKARDCAPSFSAKVKIATKFTPKFKPSRSFKEAVK
jgi:nucleoid DNA-binding protein